MLSSVMIIMLATLHRVLADDQPTYCLITKHAKDHVNFSVQAERCADGVEHCLITLSVTNDTTRYVRQNFQCWPWPELQSSCPAQQGVCQLLHTSDDQLLRTCCCRGSMCNNATLDYVPLQNVSALSRELRTRLATFGLRDPTGQLLPAHLAHLNPSSVRSTFHNWFESQSTRLVLACLAVFLACLSVGLVVILHYCPTTTNTPISSQPSFSQSFILMCRARLPFLVSQHHPSHPRKSHPTTTQKSGLFTCCSFSCVCPFGQTARTLDRTLSVTPPCAQKHSHGGRYSLVAPNTRPDESEDNCEAENLLRLGHSSTTYPRNHTGCVPQSTAELELMQGIVNSCQLLRCIGHGRFAEVWLANVSIPNSSSSSPSSSSNHDHPHRHAIDSLIPTEQQCNTQQMSIEPNVTARSNRQSESQSNSLRITARRSSTLTKHPDGNRTLPIQVAVKIFSANEQRAWATEFSVFRALRAASPTLEDQSLGSRYNLVRMFHAYKVQTDYRIVLEFAPNGSLREFLDRGQWLQFHTVVGLSRDLARGLSYLHADYPLGGKPCVAHRDLKPENVLIRADGSACLSDFGQAVFLSSAMITAEGTTANRRSNANTTTAATIPNTTGILSNLDAVPKAGTLRYMAPEILDGAIQFDARSILYTDMYSLSLCLWELLSAVPDTSADQMLRHASLKPTPLDDPLSLHPTFHPSDTVEQSGQSRRVWLPYERELGRDCSSPQAMRDWVSGLKRRPTVNSVWFTTPLISQFYRSISECWDPEPEARLSATCVLRRLNAIHAQLYNIKDVQEAVV